MSSGTSDHNLVLIETFQKFLSSTFQYLNHLEYKPITPGYNSGLCCVDRVYLILRQKLSVRVLSIEHVEYRQYLLRYTNLCILNIRIVGLYILLHVFNVFYI